MERTIKEIRNIFSLVNKEYFNNKLEIPIFVIGNNKKNVLGYCTTDKVWNNKTNTEDKRFEISISSVYLNRTLESIIATIIHEAVHLYCATNGIKDTSNNFVYHNKNFKTEAEKRGLIIEKAEVIGWSVTKLAENTKELIKTWKIDDTAFQYYREYKEKTKVKAIRYKYICNTCEQKVTHYKELKLICGNCNKTMELQEDK